MLKKSPCIQFIDIRKERAEEKRGIREDVYTHYGTSFHRNQLYVMNNTRKVTI